MAQVDQRVTATGGISGLVDGIANLALLFGKSAIVNKFPEQYGIAPNPQVLQDNAINEIRAEQALQSNQNLIKYGLIGGAALIGLIMLVAVGRK